MTAIALILAGCLMPHPQTPLQRAQEALVTADRTHYAQAQIEYEELALAMLRGKKSASRNQQVGVRSTAQKAQ